MSGRKLNLRLPFTVERTNSERPSSERPSSRTDKLVESSFTSDNFQGSDSPRLLTSASYKSLTSVNKLKDILQKTSTKLKILQNKAFQITELLLP